MAACGAEEAQLRLPPSGDYPDGNADDLAGLPGEHAPVRGTAHGFGGAGDELVVTVFSGPGQDLAQGSQRTRAASADRTSTRDLRAQLRHLDVMRHVLELATDHVGDQDVDGVGADVQRGKTHSPGTLESGRGEEDASGAGLHGRDAGARRRVVRCFDPARGPELPDLRPGHAAAVHPRPGHGQASRRPDQPRAGTAASPAGAGDRGGGAGGHRWQARRPVSDRRLPDRLGHLDEHERERGHREPRDRDPRRRAGLEAGPSQRPREPVPVVKRRDPDRDPARRGDGDPRGARAGPRAPAARPRGEVERVLARDQNRTDSPSGRDSDPARPGVPRLRRPGGGVDPPGPGPIAGLGELRLPETQPGSSIMPGKVNPVIVESLLMVIARVYGNDATVVVSGQAGSLFELNVMMPVAGAAILESITLLAAGSRNFSERCVEGLLATDRGPELVERSPMLATALNPVIGYDEAGKPAKEFMRTCRSIRQLARGRGVNERQLNKVLDLGKMTKPGLEGPGGGG